MVRLFSIEQVCLPGSFLELFVVVVIIVAVMHARRFGILCTGRPGTFGVTRVCIHGALQRDGRRVWQVACPSEIPDCIDCQCGSTAK